MQPFLKTQEGYRPAESGVYLSLDGQTQAPLATILHDSWTAQERAAFGVYMVDIDPSAGHRWTGAVVEEEGEPVAQFEPIAVTVEMVMDERARRLACGFDYDFGDERGVHRIGTTEADLRGWDEVSKATGAQIDLGNATPTAIVTDTGPAMVTPMEWQEILLAAAVARQPIWAASFALQAMNPIPADYRSDEYW